MAQKLDKFLNMEAEDYLEVSVDLERMNKNTNKDYWVSKCDEVVHGVCALLNTFGGKLCIKIENQNVVNLENILDNVLRATEQRLKQFMSLLRFNKLIKMPDIQHKQFVYNVGCLPDKIFGPVLPIINVEDADEAIAFINSREKPLALYVFANDKETVQKFVTNTSSGAVCGNDKIMYAIADHVSFGGTGNSGVGAYHGKIGFEEFSHKKPVYVTKQMLESLNTMRYPPYSDTHINRLIWLTGKTIKKTPRDLLYFPGLLLGFLGSFTMKILGLPRYFLS